MHMQGKKTIEINPRHPLIVGLLEKVTADEEDESAKDTARLLFETALLESGFPMLDNQAFAGRVRPHPLIVCSTCWTCRSLSGPMPRHEQQVVACRCTR